MSTPDTAAFFFNGRGSKLPCGHASARLVPIHLDELGPLRGTGSIEHLVVCGCGATYLTTNSLDGRETGEQVPSESVKRAGEDMGYDNRN